MHLAANTQLGPYRIIELLGVGGMGEVYRARDTRLERDVALKVLAQQKIKSPDHKQRFILEAKAASGLNHPTSITIDDIGSAGENYVPRLIEKLADRARLRTSRCRRGCRSPRVVDAKGMPSPPRAK